jgi:hypothetical protein
MGQQCLNKKIFRPAGLELSNNTIDDGYFEFEREYALYSI